MKPIKPAEITELASPSIGSVSFSEFRENSTPSEIEILTSLSLLDSFTVAEAQQITAHSDMSEKLKQFEARQHLAQIATAPIRYQINLLIKDELRELLLSDTERFKRVALCCAKVFADTYPLKSLEFYGLAGDTEGATQHIIANLQLFLLHSDLELLLKWAPLVAKALGGGLNREKLVKAYGLLASGNFDKLKSTIREIESAVGDDEDGQRVLEDLIPLKLYIDFSYGNFHSVLEKGKTVLENTGDLFKMRNALLLNRIFLTTYFYLQDSNGFTQYFNKLKKTSSNDSSKLEQVHLNSFKAMELFLSGNYREGSEFALAACNLAEELEAEGAYFPFEAAYILMDTLLEFGEEEKSQEYVDKYLQRAIRTHQYSWIVAFYAKASLIKAQAGKIDLALTQIRKGRELVESPLFGSLITYLLDGHELVARLPLGDMERIKELLFKLSAAGNHKSVQTFNYSMEIMTNPEEAERIAELMPSDTDQDKFHKELLLATAYAGKNDVARAHLKKAVNLAIPNGYFRAFLNLPPKVKELVLELATETPTNYLENLARAIRNQTSLAAANSAAIDKPLTRQELVILRRLDSGLPIVQIAKALSISRNTIKTHLKNIYRKLAAESRHDAVNKARELMLL